MNTEPISSAVRKVLTYAADRDYEGYGKFDALNSPFLKVLTFNQPVLRFAVTQAIMRSPVDLRPWFGVRKSKNPKGIGLFAHAYLDLFETLANEHDLQQAEYCLQWIIRNPTPGYHGACWGYNFDWQNARLFFAPRGFPNCVVTVVCGEALLKGYCVTRKQEYLAAAQSAAQFLLTDLPVLREDDRIKCIGYVPIPNIHAVINVNTLASAFLARLGKVTHDTSLIRTACKLARYVTSTQTDYGAWYYTDPPGKSYIGHDNYHTGFILDGLLDTCDNAGTDEFMQAYRRGLQFYADRLFDPDGTPLYMSNRRYPYDIHGAAQGIITLSKAGRFDTRYLDMARRTAEWTIRNMQRSDGSFIYQIGPVFRRRFTLMRWCNAWMARALAELVAQSHKQTPSTR